MFSIGFQAPYPATLTVDMKLTKDTADCLVHHFLQLDISIRGTWSKVDPQFLLPLMEACLLPLLFR